MVQNSGETECLMPEGEFLKTCKNIELEVYNSSDPLVPSLCIFVADCIDGNGDESVHNEIYLPVNTQVKDVHNSGGHLTYGNKLLSNAIAMENLEQFSLLTPSDLKVAKHEYKPYSFQYVPLAGSYDLTCKKDFTRYFSTDPKLVYTYLCKAKLDCIGVSGSVDADAVYLGIADKDMELEFSTMQKVENMLILFIFLMLVTN